MRGNDAVCEPLVELGPAVDRNRGSMRVRDGMDKFRIGHNRDSNKATRMPVPNRRCRFEKPWPHNLLWATSIGRGNRHGISQAFSSRKKGCPGTSSDPR